MQNGLFTNKKNNTLYCFSPPVMLATFIIEITCAIFVLTTHKISRATSIIVALLIFLGIFQLAEYRVCTGDNALLWMRIGYVSITLLPPLGIHFISLVTKQTWAKYLSYGLSIVFILIFILYTHAIKSAMCGGNYILVNTGGILESSYFSIYYYSLLLSGIIQIIIYLYKTRMNKNNLKRNMLYWMLGGYSAFMIPTATVYLLTPHARNGIPSIMCGFAVIFAIILTLKIYPISKKLGL